MTAATRALDFDAVYDRWFGDAMRWLRAMGVPEAELEDLAQEVFLVVRRKLVKFDGANLPGWIYRIAANTASDHRRRAWFRNLFSRRAPLDDVQDVRLGPAEIVERREQQRLLFALLERMSAKLRRAFVLFEIEGYSTEEIAALEGVRAATVRTRLHHARKRFVAIARRHAKESTP